MVFWRGTPVTARGKSRGSLLCKAILSEDRYKWSRCSGTSTTTSTTSSAHAVPTALTGHVAATCHYAMQGHLQARRGVRATLSTYAKCSRSPRRSEHARDAMRCADVSIVRGGTWGVWWWRGTIVGGCWKVGDALSITPVEFESQILLSCSCIEQHLITFLACWYVPTNWNLAKVLDYFD